MAEVVSNGKALSRARELGELYLKAPSDTPRHAHPLQQPLKERIVREVGYGLSLERSIAGRHNEIKGGQECGCVIVRP